MYRFSILLCVCGSICLHVSCARLGITSDDSVKTAEEKVFTEVRKDIEELFPEKSDQEPVEIPLKSEQVG